MWLARDIRSLGFVSVKAFIELTPITLMVAANAMYNLHRT
ncbi:hypothetical protein ED5_3274 [Enterobacter roggenkampii]|nr:hypothetical protein ED5_3274 [Enterobacter roggenkampii]